MEIECCKEFLMDTARTLLTTDVSAHNFRKKRAFFVKGATVAKKCINKSRTIRKKGRPALHFWC